MLLREAKHILKKNGYLLETSKYDKNYDFIKQYLPDAVFIKIQRNRAIRSALYKSLYGWECEFILNGKHHWFSFGNNSAGFESSFKNYIAKYCGLSTFDEYVELKNEYPEATLEDFKEISEIK